VTESDLGPDRGAILVRSPAVAADGGEGGVRRRFPLHQLRHAHAVEMAREGVPLNVIQRQLGHANLEITSVYLQGIDNAEIIDTAHARRASIPEGRRAAYKDVARAGGNVRGAQAVGTWLRRVGHGIRLDYRVLTVMGRMPDTFRPAGWEAPADRASALAKLKSEGVAIDDHARAAQSQRFSATDWGR
jgi:alkylated DNA nucleotide flippase Atl1